MMSHANWGSLMTKVRIKTLRRLPLLCATCAGAAHLTRQESTIVTVTWRNGFAVKGPQQPQQPVFRRQPGNDVRVNTLDILLFQSVLNPTYVNAVGWSVMDMETPGPAQSKWMEASYAQMGFLAILIISKQRNASVTREPHQPLQSPLLPPQLQPRPQPRLQSLLQPRQLRPHSRHRRRSGNDAHVNALDIVPIQTVLNPTYVNAV